MDGGENLEERLNQEVDEATMGQDNPIPVTPIIRSVPFGTLAGSSQTSPTITVTFQQLQELIQDEIKKDKKQAGDLPIPQIDGNISQLQPVEYDQIHESPAPHNQKRGALEADQSKSKKANRKPKKHSWQVTIHGRNSEG